MTKNIFDDEKDMILYKSGDLEAFNRLYQRYSPMVYGFIRKKLPTEEIEDFFQNVWIHLHQKKDLYHEQPFAPWFFFMIKNLITDFYRHRSSRSRTVDNYKNTLTEDQEFQPLEVTELLETLPLESRILVEKYYLEGQDYADLEKEMKVSQTGLRKRLSRAISSLRKSGVKDES